MLASRNAELREEGAALHQPAEPHLVMPSHPTRQPNAGPADDSTPAPASPLAPRWGSDSAPSPAPEANATNTTAAEANPFVSRDTPAPLVQSAQGAGVSGGRTIGFSTGRFDAA